MRKRITIITVCLVLGAVVNVLVAWGCVLWSPDAHRGQYVWHDEPDWIEIPKSGPVPLTRNIGMYLTRRPARLGFEECNWWTDQPRQYHAIVSGQAGWPVPSMKYCVSVLAHVPGGQRTDVVAAASANPLQGIEWGLPTWRLPASIRCGRDTRRLPLMPVWVGFATNSILNATVLCSLVFSAGALRRVLRAKRGWCVRCGYDMGGISGCCPECGTDRTGRMIAATD